MPPSQRQPQAPRSGPRRQSSTPAQLTARLAALGVSQRDLSERFLKGSGPGGQKINKSASCAYLKHLPTGIEIKCQAGRSLAHNRAEARRLLCVALEKRAAQARLVSLRGLSRTRAQNRRPTPRQRTLTVTDKRLHSEKKRRRQSPRHDE